MPSPEKHSLEQAALLDALRASEQRFRLAAEFSYDWEYWEGTDGQYVYISPSCARITGYTAEEFLQEPEIFTQIVHPDDRAAVESHRQEERWSPGSHTLNYRIIDRTGQEHWIGHVCRPVHDASGVWLGWRGTNRDITDQVRAEQALEQAYEKLEAANEELRLQNKELLLTREAAERHRIRYQELFDLAPDGYLQTDLRGVVQEANCAAAALLGSDVAILVGQPLDRFLFPEDRPTYYAYLDRLQASALDQPMRPEMPLKGHDGRAFHAQLSVTVGYDRAGHRSNLRWLIRDMTESKRAQDALHESEAKLRALFEILPAGISILDSQRRIRYTNPALARILDLSLEDLEQGRYQRRTYLHADGRPMATCDLPSVRAFNEKRTIRDVQIGVIKEDGTLIWTNVSAVPLPFDDWSVILVTVDVTEQVLARQHVEELAAEARHRADEVDAILASISDGVVVYDDRGNYVKANAAARAILGRDPVGYGLAEIAASTRHRDGTAIDVERMPAIRALRGETVRNQRLLLSHAAGQEMSMLISAAPLYTGDAISGSVAVWHDVTQVEEAEHHRDRLIAILEATPDFVSTARPNGQVLYYNEAARRILGIEAGTDVTSFRIPAGQPQWAGRRVEEEGIPAAIRDGIWRGATALVDTTGREIPTSQIILAHKDPEGQVEYLSTVAHDVSREQQSLAEAQKARQEAEEQAALLDTMLASLAEMVILYDPDTRILRANPAANQMLAFPEGMSSQTLAERVAPLMPIYESGDPVPLDDLPTMRALRGELVKGMILGLQLSPGVLTWLSASAAPVHGPGGVLRGAIASLTDITELRRAREELEERVRERTADLRKSNEALQAEIAVRRQVEADLRESELRFRQLAENVDEMFWLWEPQTERLLYVSPAYKDLWDRPIEEVYRRPGALLDSVHPDDRDLLRAIWEDASKGHEQQFRIVRPDGAVRWLESRTFPVENDSGPAQRLAAIVCDVTNQKASQAAMLRAERLTTTGQLAASLAHEINNPLQSAIGCLDLSLEALDRGNDPRRYLEVVCEALERSADIVGRLRNLHRQLRVEERSPADLRDLLERVLVLSQKKCQTHSVAVSLEFDQDLPLLLLQADAMQQVFLNLVLNAVDAMPDGGELRIAVERSSQPDGVRIRFADTGVGVPPEVLEHLFEPFTSSKAEGLGLGLFISQNIVQQHNGNMQVESRESGGTVFSLWLPA